MLSVTAGPVCFRRQEVERVADGIGPVLSPGLGCGARVADSASQLNRSGCLCGQPDSFLSPSPACLHQPELWGRFGSWPHGEGGTGERPPLASPEAGTLQANPEEETEAKERSDLTKVLRFITPDLVLN
ncbi:hypothetical protein H920_15003 [Fukomys damarensis]|uniref:Uncharacterized protein n=1 Tax=Fukomys damarensis TaxID=885580 RepID=A0A091CVV8_FUKDA|nr:hypothetical protein H920_15003 [Fukomys damarensis]